MRWQDIVAAAILIPVVGAAALWAFRHLGVWLLGSLQRSFGMVVVEVMAPDMAHLATKVTASIDELRLRNTADHHLVQGRLDNVEERLTHVEERLETVENKIGVRPPDARTRTTDIEETPARE